MANTEGSCTINHRAKQAEEMMLLIIPMDFDVRLVGSVGAVTIFAEERQDYFHLVLRDGATSRLWQYHVPHFRVAAAVTTASAAAQAKSQNADSPISEQLLMRAQPDGVLGIVFDGDCVLLNAADNQWLAASFQRAADLLETSGKRVLLKDGAYRLSRTSTTTALPVAWPGRKLVEAISFERALLRKLSATRTFGIYSALCTHLDFPCAVRMLSTQQDLVSLQFQYFDPDRQSDDFIEMAQSVQRALFAEPIWGRGIRMSQKKAVTVLAAAVSTFDPVQGTQFVLMNGMHGGSMFLPLGVLAGVISFQQYMEFQTAAFQPDSADEQWLRRSTAYIELFGALAAAG